MLVACTYEVLAEALLLAQARGQCAAWLCRIAARAWQVSGDAYVIAAALCDSGLESLQRTEEHWPSAERRVASRWHVRVSLRVHNGKLGERECKGQRLLGMSPRRSFMWPWWRCKSLRTCNKYATCAGKSATACGSSTNHAVTSLMRAAGCHA